MKIEPFPGKLEKQLVKCKRSAAWKIVLTDEQRAWLIRWFPEEENPRLLKLSGMSHSTLHRYARELHLTKSAAIDYIRKKSIRPQNTWKPSETDIMILEKVFNGKIDPKDFQETLSNVLEQLKKLKEG